MSWSCIQGDTLETMPLQLIRNDVAYPLEEGDTIVLHYIDPDGDTFEKTLTVVDEETGQLEAVWEDGKTDIVGAYRGQVKVTRLGETLTFPDDGAKIIWWVHKAI